MFYVLFCLQHRTLVREDREIVVRMQRKGFTLIELLIVVGICGVLTLASVSMFVGNSDAVRATEARATMEHIKDRARTFQLRTGKAPNTFAELGMSESEVKSSYFSAENFKFNSSGKNWKITCTGVYTSNPSSLVMTTSLITGTFSYSR